MHAIMEPQIPVSLLYVTDHERHQRFLFVGKLQVNWIYRYLVQLLKMIVDDGKLLVRLSRLSNVLIDHQLAV